jgi:Porin PorA
VRRALGILLVGVGMFCLAMTILFPTVVVDRSKKTPLNLDITQVSSGPAKVLDAATGQPNNVKLRATRVVRTDSTASDGTNTTVNESLCIVVETDPKMANCVKDSRLLSLTTDRVTANRRSAESVHVAKYGENVDGNTSVRHTGLSYKWPIDAKKQTYQFYLPDLKKAFPAKYQGTTKRAGLTVYQYRSATGTRPYQVQGVFPGTYNDVRTVWVEPRTGAIIDGTEHQVQTLADGTVALDTTLSFEKSAIDFQSNYAKDKINQLRLAQLWAPLATGIIGVLAIFGGVLLSRGRRRSGGDDAGTHRADGTPLDDLPEQAPVQATGPVATGSPQT